MQRQNLFADDPWDVENPDSRSRMFWRPDDARIGATLYELGPGYDSDRIHMHYGKEEMFFVLSGHPVVRNLEGEEELAPGEFLFCPEGRAGLHAFSNPHAEPARILAMSVNDYPDVVAYPPGGVRLGGDAGTGASARRRSGDHGPVRVPDGAAGPASRLSQRRGRPRGRPHLTLKRCDASRTCSGCAG